MTSRSVRTGVTGDMSYEGDTAVDGVSLLDRNETSHRNNNHNNNVDNIEDLSISVENLRVQAPSNLPAGYQMETEVDGRGLLVTVPRGGVKAGDFFTPEAATMLSDIHLSVRGGDAKTGAVPFGDWRDSLWSFCAFGPCHCTVWNSICCPLLAAAQVITRLQLTWFGTPATTVAQVAIAFQVIVMILVAYFMMRVFIFLIIAYLDPNADPNVPYYVDPSASYFFFAALDDLLFYMYLALVVIILRNIRSHIRQRYSIPESEANCCPGCEDVCCSLFCPCLTVAQMMRHTADYETHKATCCSRTGLERETIGVV